MRAVVCRRWGGPEDLILENVAEEKLGPDQIRIANKATGVSFGSSLLIAGKYQRKPPFPFSPGTEVAGDVVEIGSAVTRFNPGDKVVASLDWGGLSERPVSRESNTFALPRGLDYAPAIALPLTYATSAAALTWPHLLNLQQGQWLLVHGAGGGVGLAACEIGRILGAQVIATASTDEKRAQAKAHGAQHVIDYTKQDFREAVLELTQGSGVEAIYDPVGGEVFDQSLRCLAPEGRICPVGFASGRIPKAPANILLVKNVSVVGLNYGYYIGWSPHDARLECFPRIKALMDRLQEWSEAGRIKPTISASYRLDQYVDAFRAVIDRKAIGRVAIVP
ncbi:MAG: NADPH:quinone oxidoreductase family protein [Rhodospirillales bacterium]